MHETTRRANNAKSKIRTRVEHVFADHQKHRDRSSDDKIGMANLVYNIKRLIFRRSLAIALPACVTQKRSYQIPIKLNQQPVFADLLHAENNSLIEPSIFKKPGSSH